MSAIKSRVQGPSFSAGSDEYLYKIRLFPFLPYKAERGGGVRDYVSYKVEFFYALPVAMTPSCDLTVFVHLHLLKSGSFFRYDAYFKRIPKQLISVSQLFRFPF